MSARVLDGQALATTMQEEIRPEVAAFTAQHGRAPGLGIVLVRQTVVQRVRFVFERIEGGPDILRSSNIKLDDLHGEIAG